MIAVAAVASRPADSAQDAQVVRYDNENDGDNTYKYGYNTSNGISASEEGHLENVGTDDESLNVKGSFEYVGEDGVTYKVDYTADENGFKPTGAHIPQ